MLYCLATMVVVNWVTGNFGNGHHQNKLNYHIHIHFSCKCKQVQACACTFPQIDKCNCMVASWTFIEKTFRSTTRVGCLNRGMEGW